MEKKTIPANADNDLKYRDGLLEDDEKKKLNPNGEFTEKVDGEAPLEYFTE